MSTDPDQGAAEIVHDPHDDDQDLIAIVGLSCRFPGATTTDEYWRNLRDGTESLTTLTSDQLAMAGVTPAEAAHPDYVAVAPLIDGADEFDAEFFGYTPREAEIRDPQGRLFLEHCYSAIEDAGHDPRRLPGHVGVFGGMANNLYGEHQVARNARVRDAVGLMAIEVSNSPDYLCTAVSYRLGLKGPSLTVQTACSSALVAVHLACQSLRAGECDLALAGGVEVELPYGGGYTWSEGSIYSRDGHVRPFSEDASGTIFGTGVGVVLLRRLSEALADGDPIHAVIRGSAVNNDGRDRAGFTAPGVSGQSMLIQEALADARLHPSEIGFVEAHATGTLVGDPIEMESLRRAFLAAGDLRRGQVPVGSVKGNIGHLGPAAGMAGLAKVCLSMKHGVIPPTINVGRVNHRLDFQDSPFYVATEPTPWPDAVRRAGISSFGIGGTNAHVILEQPPATPGSASQPAPATRLVLPLSARTPAALASAADRLATHLETHPDTDLAEVAWTLQAGRTRLDHRAALVASDTEDALRRLRLPLQPATAGAGGDDVVVLLPGQGAQFPAMAARLWHDRDFRAALEPVLELMKPELDVDVRALLLAEHEGASDLLAQTWVTQPLLLAVEIATVRMVQAWGLQASALLGHSLGELTAAHLSGVLSLEDVVTAVCARGQLMHECPPGAMAAVAANWSDVAYLVGDGVDLAAVNAPAAITISGSVEAIEEAERALADASVGSTRLRTSHGFHSRLMAPAVAAFERVVAGLSLSAPRTPVVSGVTGGWLSDADAVDPAYWASQIREPVQFHLGAATVAAQRVTRYVEAGPGRALSTFVAASTTGTRPVTTMAPDRATRAVPDAAEVQAGLWACGAELDWARTWERTPRRAHLPGYPFERRRFWVDADPEGTTPTAATTSEPGRFGMTTWVQTAPAFEDVATAGRWLVIGGPDGLGEQVAAGLVAAGGHATTLTAGPWSTTGDRWSADLSARDQLSAAIEAYRGTCPDGEIGILDTRLGVSAGGSEVTLDGMPERAVARFGELLVLGQTIAAFGDLACTLVVATANRESVAGAPSDPAEAIVSGPVLLIEREIAGVSARSVDLDVTGRGVAGAARDLVRELGEADPAPRVSLRAGGRYVLQQVELDLPQAGRLPVRAGATYVISGGLGGLGLRAAGVLAAQDPVHLVLLGRRNVPARSAWQELRHGDDRSMASLIGTIEELELAGAEVSIRSVDVTDAGQVDQLAAELQSEGRDVAGVVHCAGLAGGGMLAMRTRADADAVLAPKVQGTVNLYRAFHEQLDFLVLYSSITAVTGTFGMVDYCAANNFIDGFAHWADDRGTRTISIGWGGWSGVGMVEDLNAAAPAAFRALQDGVSVEAAQHALLDRRTEVSETFAEFETDLWPGRHWISSEHHVAGVETVVGAALLELVRGAYAEAVGGQPEMSDVVHLRAAQVHEPVVVRIQLRRGDEAAWGAVVETAPAGPATREWSQLLVATLRPTSDLDERRIVPAELAASLPQALSQEELDSPSVYLTYGERWHIAATSFDDTSELVEATLPEHAEGDVRLLELHPALFDVAVAAGQHNPMILARDETYLPMSYELIRWRAPLTSRLYSHIRHRDDRSADVEVVDVDIYDGDGRLLCEVLGFAMRRIDRQRFGQEGAGAVAAAAADDERSDRSNITPEIGDDSLRRILAGYPQAHVVVAPEGLTTAIRLAGEFDVELVEQRLGDVRLTAARHTEAHPLPEGFRQPSTHLEIELAEIWSSVLGVEHIGLDDNFFDLGGNSLVAVQVASRIRTVVGRQVGITTLFDQQTLGALAASLESTLAESAR